MVSTNPNSVATPHYEHLVEQLMQFFSRGRYEEDIKAAKGVYFERIGSSESNDDIEIKMIQFVDWYIFSRPLLVSGRTPVQEAMEIKEYHIGEDHKELYKNLVHTIHSLFEFIKITGKNDVYVRDLASGKKYVIKNSHITVGFNKGEVFEARLIPDGDNFVFAKSFCFHPAEASKYIQKELKRVKKLPVTDQAAERETLILKLYKMRSVFDQYKHIDLGAIYSNDSRFAN